MRGFLAFLVFVAAASAQAAATSITVANTTDNVAYLSGPGGGPTDYFSGGTSNVGAAPVDLAFATQQLAVSSIPLAGGGYVLDFRYTTLFSGSEVVSGAAVYYPDIFLRSNSAGYSAAPFDYAISLGDEEANGGLQAGFYAASSSMTSQQIWSGRPGFIYTGQYTDTASYQAGQAGYVGYDAPTVLTGGTRLAGVSVGYMPQGTAYVVDASLTLNAAQAALFANSVDVFWGTGDCANGAFLATLQPLTGNVDVPEPATRLLFGAGLITLTAMRRRNVRCRFQERAVPG